MYICDRSKTELDQAKIKLTGHFDRRHFGRYFLSPANSSRRQEL